MELWLHDYIKHCANNNVLRMLDSCPMYDFNSQGRLNSIPILLARRNICKIHCMDKKSYFVMHAYTYDGLCGLPTNVRNQEYMGTAKVANVDIPASTSNAVWARTLPIKLFMIGRCSQGNVDCPAFSCFGGWSLCECVSYCGCNGYATPGPCTGDKWRHVQSNCVRQNGYLNNEAVTCSR